METEPCWDAPGGPGISGTELPVPSEAMRGFAVQIEGGPCPKCQGPGQPSSFIHLPLPPDYCSSHWDANSHLAALVFLSPLPALTPRPSSDHIPLAQKCLNYKLFGLAFKALPTTGLIHPSPWILPLSGPDAPLLLLTSWPSSSAVSPIKSSLSPSAL